MQSRFLSALLFAGLLWCSCSEPGANSPQPTQKDTADNATFFPVTKYLRGQLREMDSLPVTPLKIVTYDGKVDSTWMKKEDLRPFAEPFLHPEIDTANLKGLFAEKSFLDQTINAFTFSYEPIASLPDSFQLKRWDVYIDAQKNTIKRIYLVKEIPARTDPSANTILQLTWKSNQWCKITTITTLRGKKPDIKEEMMKWDFNE